MPKDNYYYKIHNIISIKSEIPLFELEYFACDKFDDSDMIIKRESKIKSGFSFRRSVIDDEYAYSNTIKYSEHFGPLGSQFKIKFSHPIEISVNYLIAKSRHVLYVNLVEPILRFMMISRGYILLHSACLSVDGKAILLSAPPDTGKTTTVLKCVKDGFHFLSDDMTIIRLPNTALCFPKPMTISSHTFKTAVNVAEDTSNKFGLKLRSKVHSKRGRTFMRDLSKHNVPIFTFNTIGQMLIKPPKYGINDISKSFKVEESKTVGTLCFLQTELEEVADIDKNTALEKVIENSDDAFLFPPYKELIEYIKIDGKSAHELLQEEKMMLKKLLSGLTCLDLKSKSKSWNKMVKSILQDKLFTKREQT